MNVNYIYGWMGVAVINCIGGYIIANQFIAELDANGFVELSTCILAGVEFGLTQFFASKFLDANREPSHEIESSYELEQSHEPVFDLK